MVKILRNFAFVIGLIGFAVGSVIIDAFVIDPHNAKQIANAKNLKISEEFNCPSVWEDLEHTVFYKSEPSLTPPFVAMQLATPFLSDVSKKSCRLLSNKEAHAVGLCAYNQTQATAVECAALRVGMHVVDTNWKKVSSLDTLTPIEKKLLYAWVKSNMAFNYQTN